MTKRIMPYKQIEAAQLLGVTDRTIRNYITRGLLKVTEARKVTAHSLMQLVFGRDDDRDDGKACLKEESQ